ncbi:right-handed parallel beta-helix repeat-containing protein [Saltatorellus ferox]
MDAGNQIDAALHVVAFPESTQTPSFPPQLSLENLAVTGGRANDDGSQLGNYGRGVEGAGILIESRGNVLLDRVTVVDNWAGLESSMVGFDESHGGGIYVNQGGLLASTRLRSCTIRDNHAELGAGIYCEGGAALRGGNCRFFGNGRLEMSANPASGLAPQCLAGGAIYLHRQTDSKWNNSLIYDNVARESGGGLHWEPYPNNNPGDYEHSMTHCTVTLNVILGDDQGGGTFAPSTMRGAGIHVSEAGQDQGTKRFYVNNSIVYGNRVGREITVVGNSTSGLSGAFVRCDFSDVGQVGEIDVSVTSTLDVGVELTPSCINQVPFFMDIPGRDFRLRGLMMSNPSPCVDTASSALIGLDIVDIDRDTFTNDDLALDFSLMNREATTSGGAAVPDMGAYEQ